MNIQKTSLEVLVVLTAQSVAVQPFKGKFVNLRASDSEIMSFVTLQ